MPWRYCTGGAEVAHFCRIADCIAFLEIVPAARLFGPFAEVSCGPQASFMGALLEAQVRVQVWTKSCLLASLLGLTFPSWLLGLPFSWRQNSFWEIGRDEGSSS